MFTGQHCILCVSYGLNLYALNRLVGISSPLFYPLSCWTQAITVNMYMQVASLGPGIGACLLAICHGIEREWLKINASSADLFRFGLHKVNTKYITMGYLMAHIAQAGVCYLCLQSLSCVTFVSVSPWGVVVNSASVLWADVNVACDTFSFATTHRWAVIALALYGAGIMVRPGTT